MFQNWNTFHAACIFNLAAEESVVGRVAFRKPQNFILTYYFFFLLISRGLPCLLSCLHHLTNNTTLHCDRWGRIRVLDIGILYDYIKALLNNRSCHWNKSQAFEGRARSYANLGFILLREKIGAGGINLWSIPNISAIIWRAQAGLLYMSMGDSNNLFDTALHHQGW